MMPKSPRNENWTRRQAVALLSLIMSVHLGLSLLVYRPLRSFWTESYFDAFDFGALGYQMHAARGFFAASHHLWGYDPFLLAGNLLSFVWNSSVFLQVAGVVLWWLSPGAVLKVLICLMLAATPWLLYLGWRGFGFSRRHAVAGVLAGVFWFRLSMAMAMYAVGMLTGLLVFLLSFASLGLVAATLRGEKRGWWLA